MRGFVHELVEVAHMNLMFLSPKTRETPLNIYFKANTSQRSSLLQGQMLDVLICSLNTTVKAYEAN